MRKFASRPRRLNQGGQGMTEYIIIVALIVIAAIGVYSFFGQTTRQQDAGAAKKDASGKMAAKESPGEQGVASQVPMKPGETKAGETKTGETKDAGDSKSVGGNK
jgi:hypothetical protein